MANPTPNTFHMPARGERAAPTFDRTKPRELIRFFEELEYLFDRASLNDEAEKKKHVLRYVDFEVEQLWKTFPEYTDGTKTYQHFKAAILIHYPDASGDYVYSLRDVDLLIGERQRLGISNMNDLSDFHLKFLSITSWLIEKQQLGTLEQQRSYLRAFQPRLLGAINNRLQMKSPDHHPNVPHTIKDVYEAARFILQSATTAPQNYFAPTPPNVNPSFVPDGAVSIAKREPSVKQEDFGSLFSEFTKSIVEALNQNSHGRTNPGAPSQNSVTRGCNFCGGPHFIRECEEVNRMIQEGLCKRNSEGKVVLPSGAYVPRDIPGNLLSERIKEWHRRNPNQVAAASLLHTVGPMISASSHIPQNAVSKPLFQLSTSDRIATIEAELYNLRSRNPKFVPVARTRAQKARALNTEDSDDEDAAAIRAARQPQVEDVTEEEEVPRILTRDTPKVSEPVSVSQPPIAPEHPYHNAKDAAYAPPATRNVGAPAKAPVAPRRPEAAYKTLPAVHDPTIAVDVYKRSMDAPITITQRELLSLSPEVRSQVRDVTTTRRIPNNPNNPPIAAQNALQLDEDPTEEDTDNISTETMFSQPCCVHKRMPPRGSIVLPDPIERYYRSLPPGQEPDPDRLIIAKESSAVRSIFAVIDNTKRRECILDPGCQIVAMSEDTCHELSLVYDPMIKLNMQSANGTTDWSLGLARNVPFAIGSITLYMQVHIIGSPAYDVLLGAPSTF
jgi:metal-sulfur cluster biosynthetic enzyme